MGALNKRRLAVATAFAVAGLTATAAQSCAAATPALPASQSALSVPIGYRAVPAMENVPVTSPLSALNGHMYYSARMTRNVEVVPRTSGISRNGVSRYRDVTIASRWWGYEVWFDAWATNHIIYGIAGGGVVAVIIKEAGGSSWVVSAAIAAAGVYANFCKHRDGTTDFVFIGRSLPFLSWYCH